MGPGTRAAAIGDEEPAMNGWEPAQTDLDPALEHLMSELDYALFTGRPTRDLEHEIAERFGDTSSEMVATLKALHSVRGGLFRALLLGSTADRCGAVRSHPGDLRRDDLVPRDERAFPQTVFGRFEIHRASRLGIRRNCLPCARFPVGATDRPQSGPRRGPLFERSQAAFRARGPDARRTAAPQHYSHL